MIKVALEGGRLPGRGPFSGRWQSAESLDINGDAGQDVLEVGLVLPSVATAPQAVAVGELVDRALAPGADRIAVKGVNIPIRLLSWVFPVDGEAVGMAWCGTR